MFPSGNARRKDLKLIMSIRSTAAVALCKGLQLTARLLHRGGTAMPGRNALKLCPDLAGVLAKGMEILLITGTNGKTTTARICEQAFADAGLDCVANRSGANLLSGITTELCVNSGLNGRCRKRYAVIECDEAAARRAIGYLQPKAVLVTNLFRDQLDRYGEVTHTLENIREGLRAAPGATLVLNADCSLTASLAEDLPNPVVWYGMDKAAADPEAKPSQLSDAVRCIRCKTAYVYDYVTYAHLGGFRCPHCGYARHEADVAVIAPPQLRADGSRVRLNLRGEEREMTVKLPAVYNVYNALGAVAAVTVMGLPTEAAVGAPARFHCGFGRMETFELGKAGARVMLVKNPAGCDQVLRFLEQIPEDLELAVLLNDKEADGTDISWVWDAQFELLAGLGDRLKRLAVGGTRAWDMYLRLKYAGVPTEKLRVERDSEALIDQLAQSEVPVFIMPTYTALLEFRPHLIRRCGGQDFWEG